MSLALLASVSICSIVTVPRALAASDYEGPVGVTGIFNGNVATGCSYDPLTHSAHRVVDDIVVPGSVGKYPLKMTRYYNSRAQYYALSAIGLGHGWAHEYSWLLWSAGHKVVSPHGSVYDNSCEDPVGVSEGWEGTHSGLNGTWRLADGGRVFFENARARYIDDPYGLRTTITYDAATGLRTRVTEPGGRYLAFTYADSDPDGTLLLTRVEAHGLGNATVTDWVNYSYTLVSPGGSGASMKMLTGVNYGDGTSATYTYRTDNVTEDTALGTFKIRPLLETCNDVRYSGPMRQIVYQYQSGGPHGVILSEKNLSTGSAVSTIAPGLPTYGLPSYDPPTLFTETRGDSPTRTFTYTRLRSQRNTEGGVCPDYSDDPHQQMLLSYTDFQGHTTALGYDLNWYNSSVTDARGYITSYLRGPPPPTGIGEILQITHPDGSTIKYTYTAGDPHYVATVTDERGNITSHTRDAVTHRITRTDHKDSLGNILAYETFTYNAFGQVLTHQLKNGAYERFAYDNRGLLTDKWNPKLNSVPLDSDPHTHFTYYASGPWTDRVQTETLPANASSQIASQTYEYDRNASNVAVAGRGLVTKITHADGKYQAFGYDAYGNKLWEENELRQPTTYTYDAYNRVLTAKNPLNQTVTNTYTPTNGSNTSPYVHTTSNPDTTTTPTGIVTKNDYDENFRKTSVTAASGTTLAATTTFGFDAVGNPTTVTDPLSHSTTTTYDNLDRKKTVTNALSQTTTFNYDAASNVTSIVRPDSTTETKSYDAMNRVLTDTVPQTSTVNLTTTFAYNPSGTIASVTDPKGQVTTFTYDASDQKIKMTYPGGTQFQSWTYDDAHNLASRTTVGGKIQSFTYDNRNRRTGMSWSNGADSATFGYDDAARLTTATNPNSTITRSYDAAGRLTLDRQAVTGLASKDANYVYDADGKQTRMYVTGAGYDYSFSYDAMGRFEKITPTGGSVAFQYYYDAASNETQRYNWANGGVTQIDTRDALNRMSRRDVKKGTTTLSYETYGYDPMSRLTSVAREDGSSDGFGYYLDGELNSANYGAAPTPTPTPTPSPTPTPTVATPTFNPVAGTYPASDYPKTITISTATAGANIRYTTNGTTPTMTTGTLIAASSGTASVPSGATLKAIAYKTGYTNSAIASGVYSVAAQVATPGFSGPASLTCAYSVTVAISTTTSGAQIRYTIDGTTPTSTHGTLISGSSGSATFSIAGGTTLQAMAFKSGMTDSAVRSGYWERDCGQSPSLGPDTMAATSSTPRSVTYNLDKAGNRTSIVDTGVTKSYSLNTLNQYTAAEGVTVTNGSEHEVASYQGVNYTYINDERLSSVTSGANTYSLYYDALGRCVKRTLNNVTTYYIYDGEKPVLEYNSAGAVVGRNVYGKAIDEILMRTDTTVNGGQPFYYQQDHEGSVTHLTNASGNVIEKYRYDAFGAPTIYNSAGTRISTSTYKNRFLFTGREYAATFSFYEYRARAYNPTLGRFTSEDPMGFAAGDYNLFRYCHNDPLDMTDPMGLDSDIWTRTIERMQAYVHAKEMFGGGAIQIGGLNYAIGQLSQARGGLTMAPVDRQQKGADPKVSLETRLQGMEATNRSGQEYLKTNTPYGVRVYELGGQIHYTKPVEGKPGMSGSFTEAYPPSPPGAHTTTFGHWHMPGSRSFSPLDNHLGNLRPIFKNFDPVRGLNHNNFYGPRQEYQMIFHGLIYHLDHYGDYVGVPHSF